MNVIKQFRERFRKRVAKMGGNASGAMVATSELSGLTVKSEPSTGRLSITATATTAAVDLEREVVVPAGADVEPIMRMRSVYFNHDYEAIPCAAVRRLSMATDGSGWVITALTIETQFSHDVAVAVRGGAIRGGSIGFVRSAYGPPTDAELATYGDHDLITRKWQWWEWSITPFPCNPDAMIQGVETEGMADDAIRQIEALATSGRISMKSARMMGVPERKLVVVKPRMIPRLIGA